jgi:enoyl-CoA hydratase/carnithine racemase
MPDNLFDRQMAEALIDALEWAHNRDTRALVWRSSLPHFCAEADQASVGLNFDAGDGLLDWHNLELLDAISKFCAPIVASVQGLCAGSGFDIVLACDVIVASCAARMGPARATRRLHPLVGGMQRIVKRAGMVRAKEVVLPGQRYDVATLKRWNVIDYVVPDEQLAYATMRIARQLARGPAASLALPRHGSSRPPKAATLGIIQRPG